MQFHGPTSISGLLACSWLLANCSSDVSAVGQLPPEGGSQYDNNAGGSSATGEINGAAGMGSGVSDTSSCPVWPASKLMPYVGLFFYGPDPGPCTATTTYSTGLTSDDWVFGYDSGLVVLETHSSEPSTTYAWSNGLLTSSVTTDSGSVTSYTYGYTANSLVVSNGASSEVRYTLSPSGYPIAADVVLVAGGSAMTASYEYSGCQLSRRVVRRDGALIASECYSYEYDGAGHIVTRRFDDGVVDRFDYSCW
jgi:hypothetical protein